MYQGPPLHVFMKVQEEKLLWRWLKQKKFALQRATASVIKFGFDATNVTPALQYHHRLKPEPVLCAKVNTLNLKPTKNHKVMKTLITTQSKSTDSPMDKRFGRAHYFCIFDDLNNSVVFEENPYINSEGGAGTKTAELMVEKGINKIISGHFGPKAKELLEKFEIQLVETDDVLIVQEIINKLKN